MSSKILLTGFEPFQKEAINPSKKLALAIPDLDSVILPVSFSRAWPILKEKLKSAQYTDIILMGQSGGRSMISLERYAHNVVDADIPDEDGDLKQNQVIISQGSVALQTSYPVHEWVQKLKREKHLPVEVSFSAGGFVCNYIYYNCLLSAPKHCRVVFIHLPFLPEQVFGKPEKTHFLNFELQQEVLCEILELIKSDQ